MTPHEAATLFNYDDVPVGVREVVEDHTREVRVLGKRVLADLLAMGHHLLAVKALLEHGQWLGWLRLEFDQSEDTAERLMQAARRLPEIPQRAEIDRTALYALTGPDVPDAVLAEALDRAQTGERITSAIAGQITRRHLTERYRDRTRARLTGDVADLFYQLSPEQQDEALEAFVWATDDAKRVGWLNMVLEGTAQSVEQAQRLCRVSSYVGPLPGELTPTMPLESRGTPHEPKWAFEAAYRWMSTWPEGNRKLDLFGVAMRHAPEMTTAQRRLLREAVLSLQHDLKKLLATLDDADEAQEGRE